mmetsp:Transcript_58520/g.136755  ORF Transcript_58520/g.136755 Transcript_58520/m.136755 type:complete len:416 (+) Transcript_58520:71-1318(+)
MIEMMLIGIMVIIPAILASFGFRGRDQVVGIDLGTTFSVVAIKSGDGSVTVIPDHVTGRLLLPSVAAFLPNSTIVVGDAAAELRPEYPHSTIFNAKRFIGRNFEDVGEDAALHPFRVRPNVSSTPEDASDTGKRAAGFAVPAGSSETWVSPIDVGMEVIRHIHKSVEKYTGYPISRAVISVPAKFSSEGIQATRLAFERAGFKVMRVLEEPFAAAVAYNLHKSEGVRQVLVYDIGGGTLDVSALYMNGQAVNLMGVAGDEHLGGSDFDHRMREVLEEKLPSAEVLHKTDADVARCDRGYLLVASEQAKIALSSDLSTEVKCVADDGNVRRIVITQQEFEHACTSLYERALRPVEQVLNDMMMSPGDIDDVVLVGGASRMPRVRQLLQDFFGEDKKLHTEVDPDVTIAYGAANILD